MNDFPDVESLLLELFADDAYCCIAAPDDLNSRLESGPVLRFNRTGGGDNRYTDSARVSVDAFASTWDGAQEIAEHVRQTLLEFPVTTSLGIIDFAITEKSHIDIPWGDPNVFRRNATYTLETRR